MSPDGQGAVAWVDADGSWYARLTAEGMSEPRLMPERLTSVAVQVGLSGTILVGGVRDPANDVVVTRIGADDVIGETVTVGPTTGVPRQVEVEHVTDRGGLVVWIDERAGDASIAFRSSEYR